MTLFTPLTGVSATIVRAGLSYAAWTQIIPAVLGWMFAFIMLIALVLVGMDARGENPAVAMQAFAERFPGITSSVSAWFESRVAPSVEAATDQDTGAVHLDEIDFWGAATYIWFWLSLAGAIIGFVWGMVFGIRPRRPLRKKLLLAGAACAVFSTALFGVLTALPPSFEGSTSSWLTMSISAGLIVMALTSWSIACTHALDSVADAVAPPENELTSH